MNLIDAIKSCEWIYRKSNPNRIICSSIDHENMDLTREDILADDWEIEPKSVTITLKQLTEAWDRARTKTVLGMDIVSSSAEFDDLAKELGL